MVRRIGGKEFAHCADQQNFCPGRNKPNDFLLSRNSDMSQRKADNSSEYRADKSRLILSVTYLFLVHLIKRRLMRRLLA
jgi:hypothetical protein